MTYDYSDGIVDVPYPIPTFEGGINFDNFFLTTPVNPYSGDLHFLNRPRLIQPESNDNLIGNISVK